MKHEISLFLTGICVGMGIAAFYDMFRALRKSIPHKDGVVNLEDFLFWLVTTAVLCGLFGIRNKGILRFYIFLGLGIGIVGYFFALNKLCFPVFFMIFRLVGFIFSKFAHFFEKCKKYIKKLLILPLKYLWERIKIIRNNI